MPTGAYIRDEFSYIDNGRVIAKKTWYDPATGQEFDTFDDVGEARNGASSLPSGTVVGGFGQNSLPPALSTYDKPGATGPHGGGSPGGVTVTPTGTKTQKGGPGKYTGPYVAPASGGGSDMANGRTSGDNMEKDYPGRQPAASGGPGGGSPTVYSGASGQVGGATDAMARNQFLYNPSNPSGALGNIMRGMGINPDNGSPGANFLMRAAPGLGAAFRLTKGMEGGPIGDESGMFGEFIRNALGGNLGGVMDKARSLIPGALEKISQPYDNVSEAAANPYLNALRLLLQDNYGQGLTQVMGALASPQLSGATANAYQRGLQSGLGNAQYGLGTEGDIYADDWLSFLYGK